MTNKIEEELKENVMKHNFETAFELGEQDRTEEVEKMIVEEMVKTGNLRMDGQFGNRGVELKLLQYLERLIKEKLK